MSLLKEQNRKSNTAYLICDTETANKINECRLFINTHQMPTDHSNKAVTGEMCTSGEPVTINMHNAEKTELAFIHRLIIVIDDEEVEKRRGG